MQYFRAFTGLLRLLQESYAFDSLNIYPYSDLRDNSAYVSRKKAISCGSVLIKGGFLLWQ